MNLQNIKDLAERAINTGWQFVVGIGVGSTLFPSHPEVGGVVGASLAAVAKGLVGWYYTGAPSLLKSAVEVVDHALDDPAAKPLIDAVQSVPAVQAVEAAVAPVVDAVQAAVADAPR